MTVRCQTSPKQRPAASTGQPATALGALLLLATSAPVAAGDVVVSTTIPVDVRIDGLPVVRTFGEASVTLPDVTEGIHTFTVFRNGDPSSVDVQVPATGSVRLLIGTESIETDAPVTSSEPTGPAPIIAFKATDGEPFNLILDGDLTRVDGTSPMRMAGLAVGTHSIEIRNADLTIVWVRGSLDLVAGDDLILTMAEGRMVEVLGRPEAWRAGGSSAAPSQLRVPPAGPPASPSK